MRGQRRDETDAVQREAPGPRYDGPSGHCTGAQHRTCRHRHPRAFGMLGVSRGRCACRLRSAYLGLLMTHAAHSPGYRFDSCAASACAPAVPSAITAALRIPHQARIPGEARGTAAGRGSPATGPCLLYPSYAARHNPRLHRFRPDLRSRRNPQNEAHGPTAPAPVILPKVQPAGQAMKSKSESVRIDADTPFSVMLSFSP